MSKPSTSFFSGLKTNVAKHSPEILLGLGIAGMFTTTVLAVKATPKAMALVEEEKLRRYKETEDDTISKVDIVKTCWKCYAPAVIVAAVSTACLIGSRSVGARRMAALTAAYRISESALSEYKEKTLEMVGEKKEKQIRDKVAEERVQQHPVTKSEIIMTSNGTTLCFEPLTHRYFNSDQEHIKRAENALNKRLLHDISGYVSLNEFFDEIDLPRADVGDDIGWNTDELISISFSAQIADNGEPALVIDYDTLPKYGRY